MNAPAINIHLPNPTGIVPEATPVRATEFHKDAFAVGVELRDYVVRTPSEDGQYVHVVEHREWLEKIKQPPTPEEIEAKKAEDRMVTRMVIGCLGLAFAGLGVAMYLDTKKMKAVVDTTEKALDTADKVVKARNNTR